MKTKVILSALLICIFLSLVSQQSAAAVTITLRPGQSIEAAVNAAAPGDTILLETGTWQEHVVIRRDGVTLAAAPGATPVLDGGYRLPGGAAVGCDPRSGNCFVYSPLLSIQANDVVVDGLTIQQSRGRGIGVSNGASNVTVRNCRILNVRNAGLHVTQASFVTLEGCEVTGAANYATYSRSASSLNWPVIVNVVSGSDVIIRNNVIHENWGEGIAAGRNSQRVQILGNLVYNNYALQIYAHRTQNTLIQGNLVYFTADPTFYRGNAPSDCIVINAEEEFETARTTANVHILNNIVAGCSNNIAFWGNEGGGIPTSNILVAHNTVVGATNAALKIVDGGVLENVRVQNNIFAQAGQNALLHGPASLGSGIFFSHNLWDNVPPDSVRGTGDIVSPFMVAQMSDPQAYQPPSAATNRGVPLEVGCDFFGHGRDAQPDIGAIERGAAPSAECPTPDFPNVGPPRVAEFVQLSAEPPAAGGGTMVTLFVAVLLMAAVFRGVAAL